MKPGNLTNSTLSLAAIALLAATNASFASTVSLGTLTSFSGGDAGEGLDLTGNIIYAFNLGGTAQTVQGVNFAAAPVGGPPAGITTAGGTMEFNYSAANPGGANGADYGATANDDSLETIVNTVWFTSNWAFDLDVVPGKEYQLQLIFQESFFPLQGVPARNFDVSVGAAADPLDLVLDDFAHGLETNGANQPEEDFGVVFTHTFTTTDSLFRVALADNPDVVEDPNAVLAAVVLQELTPAEPFNITEFDYDADADTVTLTFDSIFERIYEIEVSTNLIDWTVHPDLAFGGEGETTQFTDMNPPAGGEAYYRVRDTGQND